MTSTESGTETRRARRTKAERAAAPLIEVTDGEVSPFDHPGYRLRTNSSAARRGFYAPRSSGAPSTTRQLEALNTAVIGTPTSTEGTVQGQDVLSQTPFAHDPITAYNLSPRVVTSPTSFIIGDVGAGKTSRAKTDLLRQLILRNRRAVVFDKKADGDEGEYANIARFYGSEPIVFSNSPGGTRINLLDPMITRVQMDSQSEGGDYLSRDGRYALLHNVLELSLEGRSLTTWEAEALRAALHQTDRAAGRRVSVLADMLPYFGKVADYSDLRENALDELHQAGLTLRFALNSLLEDYSGLLDGETSAHVDLASKLTSWDISQLPEEGPSVPVVMSVGYMWLMGRLRAERRVKTVLQWEEGWHAVDGPLSKLIRSSIKLSRALGIANGFNMHKGSDIPEGSPGMTIVKEAQTVYIYRQSRRTDAEWCVRTFDLAPDSADRIMHLPNGHFIAKIADRPEVEVRHIRSRIETELTYSDGALAE